jgi:hypothetical protein
MYPDKDLDQYLDQGVESDPIDLSGIDPYFDFGGDPGVTLFDWAGNEVGEFESWEAAEEYLGELLGDQYDTGRQEYHIEQK